MECSNFKKPLHTLTRLPTPVPSGEAEFDGRKPGDGEVLQEAKGAQRKEVVADEIGPIHIDIDSESSGSVSSVRSGRLWKRQSRSKNSLSLCTSDTDEPVPKAQTTDGRGRGRPPTVGKYVGLKNAQRERDRLKREEARQKAEEELENRLKFVKSPMPPRLDEEEDRPVTKEDLKQCEHVMRSIVCKSGNRKGTSQKALNWVTNKITQYIQQPESAVITRLESESKKWQEHSARLEANMKTLQEENAALKRRLEELEASTKGPSTEEMLAMVEARVQARLESALMGPAQRPSLAHEKKAASRDTQLPVTGGIVGGPPPPKSRREKGKVGKKTAPAQSLPAPVPGPSSAPPQAVADPFTAPATATAPPEKRKPERKKATAPKPKAQKGRKMASGTTRSGAPPAAVGTGLHGHAVGRGGQEKHQEEGKTAATPAASTPQSTGRAEPKLRPPRSAAVVISLTPAAVAKGLTYKGILMDAQNRVDFTGLDITRLRPKFAATGAPILDNLITDCILISKHIAANDRRYERTDIDRER
ncbi:eukaryotic translation initiation factor 3 subunit A-like [Manduca sexta]|uniref:eukaryotic translation initiation factor 3 subunit A-like n=1 Tax=Manduca sexta TaxID=7130 RepID=UPI00188EB1D2|nr:eukaryotic translation initiation factor 3 subunit A-like [Manduca sexta]